MKIISDARKRLVTLLTLVGLHSYAVGLGLILMPVTALPFFGLEVATEKFFPVQGGVFHVVMGTAYILSGIGIDRFRGLILLTILAKCTATGFLCIYYAFFDRAWIVLASAAGDGLMAAAILLAFVAYDKNRPLP